MRIKLSDEKTSKCTALINGQLMSYDACGSSKSAIYKTWNYLGQGTIYSIDGAVQKGSAKPFHFWEKP